MRFVIQRVTHASCTVDGKVTGSIKKGLMVLVGVGQDDNEQVADKMVTKLVNMRIFEDENGKTNLALKDVGGELLMISQFTLYADCKKGNRPSFIKAGAPNMASELYEYILKKCSETDIKTSRGIFGADMKIELLNDGPFTIILDSDEL
jgi:D-tyrosyl-tRNA(Tyr) deacylase